MLLAGTEPIWVLVTLSGDESPGPDSPAISQTLPALPMK